MRNRTSTDCRRFTEHPVARSRNLCFLDTGSDAPDTSRQDAVAEDMAKLSQEQWDWVKAEYEKSAGDRAASAQTARDVSAQQLQGLTLQNKLTEGYAQDRENLYRPLEQQMVQEAQAYDTPERREAAAGKAVADAGIQLDLAQAAQRRNLTRMGVDPSSGASLATGNQMSLGEAAVKTGAANKAREQVELQGYARKADAAQMGRGNASAQATSAGIATTTGNSAVTNSQQPNLVNNQGIGVVQSGANSALSGMSGAAGIYQNSSNLQAQAGDNSSMWGALGSLGGAAIFKYSDEGQKTNRKPVKPELSLAAIRKIPDAESWSYKDGSPADDGGITHVGPMAQDINAAMGDEAAPGGKVIDLVTLNGHTMNAIKALDKKVEKLSLDMARKVK